MIFKKEKLSLFVYTKFNRETSSRPIKNEFVKFNHSKMKFVLYGFYYIKKYELIYY